MPRLLDQQVVSDRLAADGKKLLRDRVELPARDMILDSWKPVVEDIRAFASGVWRQLNAEDNPMSAEWAKQRITAFMDDKLRTFRDEALAILDTAKRQAFKQQFMIDHWILDQVTPPNIQVRPKRNADAYTPAGGVHRKVGKKPGKRWPIPGVKHKEAWFDEPTEGQPNEDQDTGQPVASHEQRVDGYLKAWEVAAFAGLGMAGIQGDTPDDIDARIAGLTADGNQMDHALSRLVSTEVQVSIGDADDTFMSDYGTIVKDKRWKTMEDGRVCSICEHNNGKTEAQATHNIPAHPRCRCYWRTVPQAFRKLAGDMAMPGVGDRGMAIRDPQTGEFLGTVTVDFDGWSQSIAS